MTLRSEASDRHGPGRAIVSARRLFPHATARQMLGACSVALALVAIWLLQSEPRSEVAAVHNSPLRPAPPRSPAAPATPIHADLPTSDMRLAADAAVRINLEAPFSTLPNTPAAPFAFRSQKASDRLRAQTCLSNAVYYEAASQPETGQAAVAQVVINRVRHPAFPKTVCGVVFQGSTLPTGCQFTFTCDGSLERSPSAQGWRTAWRIAGRALDGYVEPSVGQATHYHTLWVVPAWRPTVSKIAVVGAQVFFRWRGSAGANGALSQPYGGSEPQPETLLASAKRAVSARLAAAAASADPVPAGAGEYPPPAAVDQAVDAVRVTRSASPVAAAIQAPILVTSVANAAPLTVQLPTIEYIPTAHAGAPARLPMNTRW